MSFIATLACFAERGAELSISLVKRSFEMKSRQQLKAEARKSAQAAPKGNPEIAEDAVAEADGVPAGKSRVQPVYKTQEKVGGENTHREKSQPVSEFDNPAGNTV